MIAVLLPENRPAWADRALGGVFEASDLAEAAVGPAFCLHALRAHFAEQRAPADVIVSIHSTGLDEAPTVWIVTDFRERRTVIMLPGECR
jgi:hypothetical protein